MGLVPPYDGPVNKVTLSCFIYHSDWKCKYGRSLLWNINSKPNPKLPLHIMWISNEGSVPSSVSMSPGSMIYMAQVSTRTFYSRVTTSNLPTSKQKKLYGKTTNTEAQPCCHNVPSFQHRQRHHSSWSTRFASMHQTFKGWVFPYDVANFTSHL